MDSEGQDGDGILPGDNLPATVLFDGEAVEMVGGNADTPVVADRRRLRVGVLGPPDVEGTRDINRKLMFRALMVLAIFLGTPMSPEELREWLAEDEYSRPGAGSLRSGMSRLRKVLPAGLLPDLDPRAGDGLITGGVEVDWGIFQERAAQAAEAVGDDRVDIGLAALRLVRGRVLQHGSWHGIDRMVWEMNVAIEKLAVDTTVAALAAGRAQEAAEATRLGLKAVASERLWQLRVKAAEAGSGENSGQLSNRAKVELGADIKAEGPS